MGSCRQVVPKVFGRPSQRRAVWIALILWAAGISAGVFGQTLDDVQRLVARYQQYEQAGDWDRALETAQAILPMMRRLDFASHHEASVVASIADCHRRLGQYHDARQHYESSLELLRRARPTTQQERTQVVELWGHDLRFNGYCHLRTGDFDGAMQRYDEAIRWYQQHERPVDVAQVRSAVAFALRERGQAEEAIQLYEQVVAAMRPAAQRERPLGMLNNNFADALNGLASSYRDIGRFDRAEPHAREAVNVIVSLRGWDHPYTAIVLAGLATIYDVQGRDDEALALYRHVIQVFEETVGLQNPEVLFAVDNYAGLLNRMGNLPDAERLGRLVLEARRETFGAESHEYAAALLNLANKLSSEEHCHRAEPIAREALALHQRLYGPTHPEVITSLNALALIRGLQGDPADALRFSERAIEIYQENPLNPGREAALQVVRAMQLWELDRQDEALEAMRSALRASEVQRAYSGGAERERAAMFESSSVYYSEMSAWLAEMGRLPELFATMEAMKARSFLDELLLGETDLLADIPADQRAKFESREADLRQRLSAAEQQLEALNAESNDAQQAKSNQRQTMVEEIVALRGQLYDHLTAMRAASPTYRNLLTNQTETATLDQVRQELLVDDELMLSYLINHNTGYLLVVRQDAVSLVELEVTPEQAGRLAVEPGKLTSGKLNSILLGEQGVLTALSTPAQTVPIHDRLNALWEILIPQAERDALTNGTVGLLTVLPDGPLALLPLEALVVSASEQPTYLLDAGPPVIYAPSASVLLNLKRRSSQTHEDVEPVLTLGDPDYARPAEAQDQVARHSGIRSDDERFRAGLSRLPFSGLEATWVAEHFAGVGIESVKLTGRQATEAELRQLIAGREIVHLACHGMADQSYGNFYGCLAMAAGATGDPNNDGFLYASEMDDLDLGGCELTILSACETNYGPQQDGEGVWNLSRAFLAAGSRRVIASNWVVDDKAGATLISFFTSYLSKAGTDRSARDYATSLHKAKQLVRKQEEWSSPFYWSSLVLVGPK